MIDLELTWHFFQKKSILARISEKMIMLFLIDQSEGAGLLFHLSGKLQIPAAKTRRLIWTDGEPLPLLLATESTSVGFPQVAQQ